MATTPKIRVALETIAYGPFPSLQVAVAEGTKDVYMTFPTIETILNYRPDSSRKKIESKSLKAFAGKDLVLGKFSGTVVNKRSDGNPTVSLMSLTDFTTLAAWECRRCETDDLAKLLAAGMVTNLQSLALRQLGIEVKVEEELVWLDARIKSMQTRRTFTDAVQEDYRAKHPDMKQGEAVPSYAFSTPSDTLNKLLTGHPAKYWRDRRGLSRDELRNAWSKAQLERVKSVEDLAQKLLDKGMAPNAIAAVEEAADRLMMEVWDEAMLFGDGDKATYFRNYRREARAKQRASLASPSQP